MKNSISETVASSERSKEDSMKTRILGILGGIALLLSAGSVYAGGPPPKPAKKVFSVVMLLMFGFMLPGLAKAGSSDRPLSSLAGTYSATAHGNFAFCLDSSFTEVSCTSSGAMAFPTTEVDVGQGTRDKNGHACVTWTSTDSDLTPGTSATLVGGGIDVDTVTSYDPTTQSGDESYIFYSSSSGKCVGAKFVSSGTPVIVVTGTFHFVVSANGTREDFMFTGFTDTVGGFADFAWSGTHFKQ